MTACPDMATLQQLLDEQLPEETYQAIEDHIELCHRCWDRLDRLTGSDDPSLSTDDVTEPPIGVPVIPGYEFEREIGHGGMGVVYKARHLGLKRSVALKMIIGGGTASSRQLAHFRTEAEAVARLKHPHIVQIHDFGEHEGRHYVALEYVDGSLAERLDGTPWRPKDAAILIRTLAEAAHHAHLQGVVHRDLKPSNILLQKSGAAQVEQNSCDQHGNTSPADMEPKITDFGLARLLDDEAALTLTGEALGTPSYMAPEQATGQAANRGATVDVYALGAILYELLTGRPPFKGTSKYETLEQVRTIDPVYPRQLQPRIPWDLETICLKCLRKEPEKRYAAALELADDLRRFLVGEPIAARPVTRIERLFKWAKRHRTLTVLIAVFAVLAIALPIAFYQNTAATSAERLVSSLSTADTARVPELVEEISRYRLWADPLLRKMESDATENSRERLHASLALLSVDPNQVDFLLAQRPHRFPG